MAWSRFGRATPSAPNVVRVGSHEVTCPDDVASGDLDRPLARLFDDAAREVPERQFLISAVRPDEVYSYARFAAEARAIACTLVSLGVAPGDRVAIWCGNRPRWCVAYAAILFAGAVVVPLDAELAARHLPTVLRDAEARALFVAASGFEDAAAVLPEAVRLLGLDECGELPWSCLGARGAAVGLPELQGGETVAALLYTSGTTGNPKGVVLTQRNVLAEIRGVALAACVTRDEVLLMLLPLHHLLAQLGSFVLAAAFRARVVDIEVRHGEDLLAAMRAHGVTLLVAVPLLLHLIHERISKRIRQQPWLRRNAARALMAGNGSLRRATGVNLGPVLFREAHQAFGPALRLIVSGGSALDPRAQRDLYRLGVTVIQAYGLTETCGAATVTALDDSSIGSVGLPFAGVSVRIAAPDAEGIGEVLVRGPIVTPGYYRRPDDSAKVLRDGWLHTGDLGRLDAGGRLWVTGRSKDVIVLGSGKNVYPEEVEAHYAQAAHVRELCVISRRSEHGPDRTEKLHAVVVPDWEQLAADGITSVHGEIHFEIESLSLQLPAWQRVLTLELRREPLPRTPTRKVRRFQVVAESTGATSAERAAEPDSVEASERMQSETGAIVRALIDERVGGRATVRAASGFELDLGLDSLNRMELLLAVEQRMSVAISDAEAERLSTVDDLLLLLAEKSPAEGAAGADGSSWPALLAGAGDGDLPPWMTRAPSLWARVVGVVLMGVLRGLSLAFIRVRVEGREHLPARGPYLICPNHVSFLDAGAVLLALPPAVRRQTFALGEAAYMTTWWGQLLCRAFQVVPTNANRALRPSMRAAAAALQRDRVLMVFPEGTRTPDGKLKELKQGSAILARELGLRIVPVGILGAFEAWPRGRRLPRPGRVCVRFGAPLEAGVEDYTRTTERIAQSLIRLTEP